MKKGHSTNLHEIKLEELSVCVRQQQKKEKERSELAWY